MEEIPSIVAVGKVESEANFRVFVGKVLERSVGEDTDVDLL